MKVSSGAQTVRFQLLDPLRGVAALWVFTFHYRFSDAFRGAFPWLTPLFDAGFLGVPMFFVISGYCLMASVRTAVQDRESVGSFLRRRSMRIYPPYWCSVAVVAALPFMIEGISALKTGQFVPPTAPGNINLGFLNYSLVEWLRVLTLTQVFAPVDGATDLQVKFTTINAVYWTLAIEFQFYLVMAVALALKSRAVLWLAGVTLVSLPFWWFRIWMVVGIFLPFWPMFAIGIALYLVLERGVSFRRFSRGGESTALIAIGLLIVTFAAATIGGHRPSEVGFAAGLGVFLWCLHQLDEHYRRGLRSGNRVARVTLGLWRHIGLMSYSLYLLHGRLQFLAQQLLRQVLPVGIALDVCVIVLTCAMCYIFYRACEKPFIRSRTALRGDIPAVAVAIRSSGTSAFASSTRK